MCCDAKDVCSRWMQNLHGNVLWVITYVSLSRLLVESSIYMNMVGLDVL